MPDDASQDNEGEVDLGPAIATLESTGGNAETSSKKKVTRVDKRVRVVRFSKSLPF